MNQWFDSVAEVFRDNSLNDWLVAALVFGATFLIVPFLRARIRARQQLWSNAQTPALELLSRMTAATSQLVVLSLALFLAQKLLQLPPGVDRMFQFIIIAGLALQLGLWASAGLRFAIERHYARRGEQVAASSAAVGVLMFVGQILIWAIVGLLALDNLGVNITALVAGMGVGGIAVALAVQTILGDLFGSISIALDKPFVVGDALQIDTMEGTVEHVGIKSTRLRSVTGEQIIISNADILKSRVRNMGRAQERRVLFRIQVAYENKAEAVEQVTEVVKGVIEANPGARFVQCPLVSLGQYAMEFEPLYFVAVRSDVNQASIVDRVNRGIVREFAARGIRFGYPSQRLVMEQGAGGQDGPGARTSEQGAQQAGNQGGAAAQNAQSPGSPGSISSAAPSRG
jgi:small-conductance mechanosensitive channel